MIRDVGSKQLGSICHVLAPVWETHPLPVGSVIVLWKMPFRISSVGTIAVVGLFKRDLKRSQVPKKKSLSLTNGPPSVAPYWY